jgi:hypothetical protein
MEETGGSLDRVNNDNINYTTQNVVPCCKNCNYVKSKVLTKDETLLAMEMINRLRSGDEYVKQVLGVAKRVKEEKRSQCIRPSNKRRKTE